jgi:D-glycero-beta-D-manno-heptose 1-phosphate adenylyltransferase
MVSEKLLSLTDLKKQLELIRRTCKKIVFTNGCFDILHVGHVYYLEKARLCGDLLVVGLNSDKSVGAIKGPKRPIVPQEERAEVLAGLWMVDFITIFDEIDPLEVIKSLTPDVLIKGADWSEDKIIGTDHVKAGGGEVARIPMIHAVSTTKIIDTIINRFG